MSDEPDDRDVEGPREPGDNPDERRSVASGSDSDPTDSGDGLTKTDDADGPSLETDGEGVVSDRHNPEPTYPDRDDDIGGISTPPDDEEMPLADHIEEMVLRLAVVLLFGAGGTAIGLLWPPTLSDSSGSTSFHRVVTPRRRTSTTRSSCG